MQEFIGNISALKALPAEMKKEYVSDSVLKRETGEDKPLPKLDFKKNARPDNNKKPRTGPPRPLHNKPWIPPMDPGVKNIMDSANNFANAVIKSEKTELNNVKLNMNQITPDNYSRKFNELRKLLIGDRKILGEPEFEADKDFNLNEDKLDIVVGTVFKKA